MIDELPSLLGSRKSNPQVSGKSSSIEKKKHPKCKNLPMIHTIVSFERCLSPVFLIIIDNYLKFINEYHSIFIFSIIVEIDENTCY